MTTLNKLGWAIVVTILALTAGILVSMHPSKAADGPKWTGCGVSAAVGMAATKTDATASVGGVQVLGVDGLETSGGTFGLGVGCDYLLGERFLIGAFADWTKHDQAFDVTSIVGSLANVSFDNQWSLGGRAGVLIQPTTLVYGLVAYTEVKTSDIASPFLTIAVPDLKGYSVGGGIETSLGNGFFLGAEYRFTQLDKVDLALGGTAVLGIETEVHSATARLTYKLGLGSGDSLK